MYNLIKNIVDHVWDSSYQSSAEQQIIVCACIFIICLLTIVVIDLVYRLISSIIRRGR